LDFLCELYCDAQINEHQIQNQLPKAVNFKSSALAASSYKFISLFQTQYRERHGTFQQCRKRRASQRRQAQMQANSSRTVSDLYLEGKQIETRCNTDHPDKFIVITESFIYPTDAQLDCYKMLKFTLKFTWEVLLHVSAFHTHHQGATICALLKL
jgi:hypothetical protein